MSLTAIYAKKALIGEELQVLEDACILIENDLIQEVTTQNEFKASGKEAEIIDLGDKVLLPGLIECHSHMALDARVPGHLGVIDQSECEHTVIALKGLEDELMAGITTSRSLGDRRYIDVTLKDQIKKGKVTGPDLLVCGIGMKGRHGHGIVGVPHSGVEEFRKTARENMFRGVDVLKIFVTPGAPARHAEDFIPCFISYDEICTVVEEARALNIKTAAHCIGGKGLEYCVKAGIDCIEHVYSITPEQVKMVEEEHKGWIDLTSGIVLDPGREPYLSAAHVQNMQAGRAYSKECLSRVYQNDKINWTIGTDAYHGLLYKELELAIACGAPVLKTLKGVTVNAAKMCGIDKEKGQLKAGLKADVIAVDSNPLDNVSVLADVSFVMKGGKVYKKL
ncbi:MAG: amidohydrolase family protein [Lachnospiraceae bacterium]|nr:amidohydrolase family protein [Lachnospiraceae bacterium]